MAEPLKFQNVYIISLDEIIIDEINHTGCDYSLSMLVKGENALTNCLNSLGLWVVDLWVEPWKTYFSEI